MKQNVGGADKVIRIVLGAVIIIWGIVAQNWLGLIGIILLGTALLNFCPAYLPFGISTCKTKSVK